jgi:hypothetical protein
VSVTTGRPGVQAIVDAVAFTAPLSLNWPPAQLADKRDPFAHARRALKKKEFDPDDPRRRRSYRQKLV